LLIILSFVLLVAFAERVRFDGHKVVRTSVSQKQLDQLYALELDIWAELPGGLADVRVNPQQLQQLEHLGLNYNVTIPNLQQLIDQEEAHHLTSPLEFFDDYQTYEAILAYLDELHLEYPTLVKEVISIGNSIQGRPIPAIIVSAPVPGTKPIIWANAGQHAREWISPATLLYILTELLAGYRTDEQITILLNTYDFVFLPVVNVDGYVYTWTNNRMWRKNRRANTGGSYGVDLNRNWDMRPDSPYEWCETGASRSPSSETYCGTAPFSEPETKAASDFFKSLGNIWGSIDYHSYGQLLNRPYGDTQADAPNEPALKACGDGMRDVMRASPGGALYTSQKAINLYVTTGTALSWAYSQTNAASKFAYTIELRDTGNYGFVLPASQILPTGRENLVGFLHLLSTCVTKP